MSTTTHFKQTFTLILIMLSATLFAQNPISIKLNQVGYLPNAQKIALLINTNAEAFEVKEANTLQTVYSGLLTNNKYNINSDEDVKIADFTLLDIPGTYVLYVEGHEQSFPFKIAANVYSELVKGSAKAFYFNRASIAIEEQYAGVYARKAGHPDTRVIVLPSAASESRPAGTVISTPYGWYDAGDYNKYVVNSGVSTFTLLSAYETYPQYFDTLSWNIPESNNSIPDILDEALWNLKWVMSMQDPADGGVYHKTTCAGFQGFVMPDKVTATRYVTAKSTAATLNYAALMAMAARIYKNHLPDFADEALQNALKAWNWANNNPDVVFKNPEAQDGYPKVNTGEYSTSNFSGEFSWCASELFITTSNSKYYNDIALTEGKYYTPGWASVKSLGLISLLTHRKTLNDIADTTLAKNILLKMADDFVLNTQNSAYQIPGEYFNWGSNSGYANSGMMLMHAFKLTQDPKYFNAAIASLDYLLGKNATDYCFVSGFGTKYPTLFHHRLSIADDVEGAIPGWLAGGPNPSNINDDCGASQYPSTLPAKAYVDEVCSYSTNEIAINWNAPLVFLTSAIQNDYHNHFSNSKPTYFNTSDSIIKLPYEAGYQFKFDIYTNLQWSLSTNANWIEFSNESGNGSAGINIFSNTNNNDSVDIQAMVYIESMGKYIDSVLVIQNTQKKEFVIQAEDYTNMFGVQTQNTSDEGGGLNTAHINNGDWMEYLLDITFPGIYQFEVRHAGWACSPDLLLDGNQLKSINIPETAGWQAWETFSTEIELPKGQHLLRIVFNCEGINFNWLKFTLLKETDDQ
ncbi:MAG: glycoside hydrolase family 9 protein, partial [Prolixibacteraceae bacterium]|nr:glycoside hydrolase family 9 protein [Prolixibacteraceae bacterium]